MQTAILEVHTSGRWQPAAELEWTGNDTGRVSYLPEYIFGPDPAVPISLTLPVRFADITDFEQAGNRRAPAVLYDLVPQGLGRRYLIQELGLQDSESLVFPLICAGAFNPIGNLRIDSAVRYYEARRGSQHIPAGFALEELLAHKDEFLDQLWIHGMLAAGSTGLQGVAPKFLLSQDHGGLYHVDISLPDDQAQSHWLVKLPRGGRASDLTVLKNEAAYLAVAKQVGLRVHGNAFVRGHMLFVPRFDRQVVNGSVFRLHQESLAAIAGHQGFGLPANHHDLVQAFRAVVSHPLEETIEYLKRDALNRAMRNTDNHARNTALQRLPDGTVQLTPLFDFAPMYLDEDMISRTCRWLDATGRQQQDWAVILEQLAVPAAERPAIARALCAFADTLADLATVMAACGVDDDIIQACRTTMVAEAKRLATAERLLKAGG